MCGNRTCWYDAGTCKVCSPQDERDGKCGNGCGPTVTSSPVHLVTIDPATGVATSHGELGDRFAGLAFTCDGTLYGITGDGACDWPDTLYRISTTDASKEKLATFGNGNDGEVLAFNPLDGKLYYASGDDDTGGEGGVKYLAIDPLTQASTALTFDTLLDDEEVQALAWSEADQAFLWKQNHKPGPLFRSSPDGQTVVKIGDTDHQLHGLAFAEPIAACVTCGDGVQAVSEGCDDGNTTARDCCSSGCTVEDAGYAGAACELGRLRAPTLCDGAVEAKTAKQVAKRGALVEKLLGKAEAVAGDAKKQAKRLKGVRRQLVALQKTVKKRAAKLGPTCTADVQALLARLDGIVGAI
jgi:cysteine-rich repeat protein